MPRCPASAPPHSARAVTTTRPQWSATARRRTGSGRRTINIYIDSTWDSSPGVTNATVWNAVNAAANSWNSATDPYGNKTGYYFVVNQAGGSGQADIIISRDNSLSGSDTGDRKSTRLNSSHVKISYA